VATPQPRGASALAIRAPEIDLRVTTNRYGGIKRYSLRERLAGVAAHEADPMDLMPEAQLLRALVVQYIEEYDELKDAVIAWHNARMEGRDSPGRPAALPSLTEVQKLIDAVGRLISRAHQINQTGTISLAVFRRATELMGQVVASYVHDPDTLSKIEQGWGHIALDPKRGRDTPIDAEVIDPGEDRHAD
jgi:hypothetical protein